MEWKSFTTLLDARGGAVGWGTALQVGRSRVRFPIVSSDFFPLTYYFPVTYTNRTAATVQNSAIHNRRAVVRLQIHTTQWLEHSICRQGD